MVRLLPLLVLSACFGLSPEGKDDPGTDADDTGTTGDDTGDTGADDTGVEGPSGDFDWVAAHVSTTIVTAATVEWVFDGEPTRTWVEYGPTPQFGSVAPAEPGADRAVLVGLPPSQEVHLRVVAELDGERHASDDIVLTTRSLPTTLPQHTLTDSSAGEDFGNVVLFGYFEVGSGTSGTLALDRAGEVLWYSPPVEGFVAAARPSLDGTALLSLIATSVNDASATELCRTSWDGEDRACLPLPYAHHDFVELDDGRILFLRQEIGSFEGQPIVGDQLVTVDPDGGNEQILWSSLVDIPQVKTDDWGTHITPDGVDWTHANGLWYDAMTDRAWVSFYYFQSIHEIDLTTGRTVSILGGDQGTWRIRGQAFGPQHAPQLVDGGIVLFDNSSPSNGGSRIVSYTLDRGRGDATQTLSWQHPDARYAGVLGDAHRLDNGYTATAWGDVGQVLIFSPEGEVLWKYVPTPGTAAAQVYVYDDVWEMMGR